MGTVGVITGTALASVGGELEGARGAPLAIIGGFAVLALMLVPLRGTSPRRSLLYANALIGATAGPLATLADILLVQMVTGARLGLHSPDQMGTMVLCLVLFAMAFPVACPAVGVAEMNSWPAEPLAHRVWPHRGVYPEFRAWQARSALPPYLDAL
ncbi:MAG: hypothetical protein FJ290_15315 [Planctomycetes bacterium]|nr:hypothetical protein [Planctomycetota bacterium]